MKSNSAISNTRSIFGSFKLCDEEFAISADSIREVINEPSHYSALPLAPYYLLGLFNLRGIMIPVIDLKKILNLNEKNYEKNKDNEKKISIVECGNFCVGLLFDKTGEVFNGSNSKKIEYVEKSNSSELAIVKGLFKLDNAKRIIQILDPLRLKDIKDLAKIQKSNISELKQEKIGSRKQCISFKINDSTCAFAINDIQEVVNCDEIENSAQTGELCLGVIKLRNEALPVIDIAEILAINSSKSQKTNSQKQSIIIMESENKLFGLPVDSIENIIGYKDSDFKKIPVITDKNRALITGCVTTDDNNIILLNKDELLKQDNIKSIIDGYYKSKVDVASINSNEDFTKKDQKTVSNSTRRTYITFTIGKNYALDINNIEEIIECPKQIIRPPSSSEHLYGLVESRGTIFPIIKSELFNIREYNHSECHKIIIVKINQVKCGFFVNTVNSIESFSDNERYKIPHLVRQKEHNEYITGTKETFRNKDGSETKLYVMDLEEISSDIDLSDVNWEEQ